MNHFKHPSNNLVLGAPVGHDANRIPVDDLPVTRIEINGVPVVQSYWRPDDDERAALDAGAPVVLSIIGGTMPPAWVGVEAIGPNTPQSSRASDALLTLCRAFIEKHRITCAETIHQTDRVIEDAALFIEQVCDIVGFQATEGDHE